MTTIVQLEPPTGLFFGPVVSGTPNQLVPAAAETISFRGTVKGEYPAFACGKSEIPPNCTGPQIANLIIDLAGILSLDFRGFPGAGLNEYDTATFTSIPEPSSVLLLLFGAATVGGGLIVRSRKSSKCISASR